MKTKAKWLGAVLAAAAVLAAGRAEAANPAYLYIDVTIVSNLSVAVAGSAASTATVNWSGTNVAASGVGAQVSNTSAYIAERWELTTSANSADSTNGNPGWTIGSAPASETAELQALFVSAANVCPPLAAAEWTSATVAPALLSSQQAWYTSTTLVDSALGTALPDIAATSRMNPSSVRGLCWHLDGPTSTALTHMQIVPVVVTAF
jgi:hypothetical protein